MTTNLKADLQKLIEQGLTLTDCLEAFASGEDDPYYNAAMEHNHRDGTQPPRCNV